MPPRKRDSMRLRGRPLWSKPCLAYNLHQLHVSTSAVIVLAGPVPQIDEVRRRAEALLSNAGFPSIAVPPVSRSHARSRHQHQTWVRATTRSGRSDCVHDKEHRWPKPNCRRSWTIGQHRLDGPDRVGNEYGVGAPVVGDAENAGEHPAFTPLPGGVVDAERVAVSLAGVARE
jgi:hypothetical protein